MAFSAISGITSQTSSVLARGVEFFSRDISSANDPNYQRQIINFQSSSLFQGINIGRIERAVNSNLQDSLLNRVADDGQFEAITSRMDEIAREAGFDTDTPRLVALYNDFEEALREFQSNPHSTLTHQRVIDSADAFTGFIRDLSGFLINQRQEALTGMGEDVARANNLLARIADLNGRIPAARARNLSTAALENERDTLVRDLAKIIGVTQRVHEDGAVDLYMQTGHSLVSRGINSTLTWDAGSRSVSIEGLTNPLTLFDLTPPQQAVNRLPPGSLSARFEMARNDNGIFIDSGREVGAIAKFETHLDVLVSNLLDTSSPDFQSFNQAYAQAGVRAGANEHTGLFFEGTSRADIQIHADLLDGTSNIKRQAVLSTVMEDNVLSTLENDDRLSFPAPGTTILGSRYMRIEHANFAEFVASINHIQANVVNGFRDNLAESTSVTEGIRQELSNETGVNIDEALVFINQLQKNFAINARVIKLADEMFDSLLRNV